MNDFKEPKSRPRPLADIEAGLREAERGEFATDAEGRVVVVAGVASAPVERVLLRVEASPRGPQRPDAPAAGGVWLDARLDALHFGFLPGRARALAVLVPLALLCATCAAHGLLHSPYSPLRLAALGSARPLRRVQHGD